jgi:hypothetical protein
MEQSQPKKKSRTKVAQHEGQLNLNPTFKTRKRKEVELMKRRPKPEGHLKLGKYTKNPDSTLCDPFITTEPSCQGFHGQVSLLSKESTGPRRGRQGKVFRNP